jgi:UDP-N-acetylglucosamine:LPS N-acetylglucosamine transferase
MAGEAKRALLLSGSIGMGHDVMAEACQLSLTNRGWSTELMDGLRLMGDSQRGLGERVFRGMLAVPGFYDAFHFGQLRQQGVLARAADRAAARFAVPALRTELQERPVEFLVSVFATAAGAVERLKPEFPGLKTATFCTDAVPHALWVHESTDLYLITSETGRCFIWRFHPGANVHVVPPPVRPQFYAAPWQDDARQEFEVPLDAPCVLLMSSSWGIGPLVELAEGLARSGIYTLAVAGRNASLEAALRQLHEREKCVIPFGFTDRIPDLMAASDLVITSAGDTCSEARVIGRHLLLLDVVPGHGRENLQHELEKGDADVAPSTPDGLRRSVLASLERVAKPTRRVAHTAEAWEGAFDEALASIGLS